MTEAQIQKPFRTNTDRSKPRTSKEGREHKGENHGDCAKDRRRERRHLMGRKKKEFRILPKGTTFSRCGSIFKRLSWDWRGACSTA